MASVQSPPRSRSPRPASSDRWFRRLSLVAGWSVIGLSVSLLAVLIWYSLPMLDQIRDFFTTERFDPRIGQYGALAYIYGTLITAALAMVLAVPLGIGSATYLAEIAPSWLRRSGASLIELLAAIPSVVYGFWGLFFLAPGLQWIADQLGGPNTGGAGILSAGLILAIMIVPFITAISFDVCRSVPNAYREAALALGATRWQMIRTSVIPTARPGIMAACFLALGRALGETMAVTMLIGNRASLPDSWQSILFPFFELGDSIASVIANQLNETTDETHRSALICLGLILFLVTMLVNLVARLFIHWPSSTRVRAQSSPSLQSSPPFDSTHPALAARPETTQSRPSIRLTSLKEYSGTQRSASCIDWLMTNVLMLTFALVVIPLFLILAYIVYRGGTSLNFALFTALPDRGLAHALVGSLMVVSLGTLMAVPLSVMAAIFLAEFRPSRIASIIRFTGELLAGVPSIIIGIFGYVLIVQTTGSFSGLAGAFALAVMMVPIVMRSSEESLKLVPAELRQASYALGASQWQTVSRITFPAALPAVITGVVLAVGRIVGETAPLLLTAYGSLFFPRSPLDRTPVLPKYIYDYSRSGIPAWEDQAWAAALILVTFVIALNISIRCISGHRLVRVRRITG